MTYDTMNPVPSDDPRDLDDNAKAFDRFLQSPAASEPDRLGVQRKTWAQMEADAAALVSPNVSALAGLTGAADRGFYFTGSGAMSVYTLSALGRTLGGIANAAAGRTALAAAASGANSDIISISGLTTALTVAQGGTGRTSTALYLTDLQTAGAYGKTNVLGTVSQSGGVPTGAVLESVSNANGRCTKYADGTMICEFTSASSVTTSNAIGGIFSANTVTLTFPVAFVGDDPTVSPALSDVTVAASWAGCGGNVTLTTVGIAIFSYVNNATAKPGYIAKGRWF